MSSDRIDIPGSAPEPAPAERAVGPAAETALISASIILRRAAAAQVSSDALLSGKFTPVGRAEAAEKLGADPQDLVAVETFARSNGLEILSSNRATRTVKVRGTAAEFKRAFGVSLHWADQPGVAPYLSYNGPLTIPRSLEGMVVAVLGLDQKPVARPRATSASSLQ